MQRKVETGALATKANLALLAIVTFFGPLVIVVAGGGEGGGGGRGGGGARVDSRPGTGSSMRPPKPPGTRPGPSDLFPRTDHPSPTGPSDATFAKLN